MKNIILSMSILVTSTVTFAAGGECVHLAEKAAQSFMKVNEVIFQQKYLPIKVAQTKLDKTDAAGGRASSHDSYTITLKSAAGNSIDAVVTTTKDNDEIGSCSVDSVKINPLFN